MSDEKYSPREGERLARLELKIDHVLDSIDNFLESQKKHNDLFYSVRDDMITIKASAKAYWVSMSVFGAAVVTLSGGVAWVVTTLITKGTI